LTQSGLSEMNSIQRLSIPINMMIKHLLIQKYPNICVSLRQVLCLVMLLLLGSSQAVVAQETGQFFDSNGVQIHYLDIGSGEPVVLMHGINGSYERNWVDTGVVDGLVKAGYRVLALDGRAHGQSGAPRDPAMYGPEMSLDIARLLDHVGIEQAHIVGYSMGAGIVGKLREMHPERFKSMCIGGGAGYNRTEGASPTAIALAESLERGEGFMPMYRRLYPTWSEDDLRARSDRMLTLIPDPLATAALLRGGNRSASEESLKTNTVPTLAIVGSIDPAKARVDELVGVMPNLEVVVIPDADHQAAYRRPEYISNLIRFLDAHATH
jgi:pimeloyl-ACP methyl ester carboxylesterase